MPSWLKLARRLRASGTTFFLGVVEGGLCNGVEGGSSVGGGTCGGCRAVGCKGGSSITDSGIWTSIVGDGGWFVGPMRNCAVNGDGVVSG